MDNKKLNYFTAIRFLTKYIVKFKRNFLMFYFGWLLDTILSVSMPLLFGIMIDQIVYYQNLKTFLHISIVVIVMSIFSCILYFLIYAQHHYLMNMYTFNIRMDIFRHLQNSDAEYLSDNASGEAISCLEDYSYECMHFVVRNIIHPINNVIKALLLIFYIFMISWQIGIFVMLAIPVSIIVSRIFGGKIRSYSDKQREFFGTYISWLYEVLSAFRDIRMLVASRIVDHEFIQHHKKIYRNNIKSGVSMLTAQNIIDFTNLVIQLLIFTFAGYLSLNNNITIGLLIVVITYFNVLKSLISTLANSYLDAQNRISYIQRIFNLLHSKTEDVWTGENDLNVTKGNIRFENIEFSYNDNPPTLKSLSLDIQSGEKFALVGKSGCGKTTLAQMLIGFYTPHKGFIEIDGQKLTDCTLKSIRNNIGVVSQDVLLFDGSIKANLLLGNRNATEEDIRYACKRAGIMDFVESLSEDIHTVLGTNGIGLSGGQKQRFAIARMYLKNPKIIIFDEATSSLDSETEQKIFDAWQDVLKDRTAIIIAHRQSSVMLCDKVGIIENGVIIDVGFPTDMAVQNQNFKSLFAM